jgi:hypothetical protein
LGAVKIEAHKNLFLYFSTAVKPFIIF